MYKIGHKQPESVREKIRLSRIGIKFSSEHKMKLSLAKLGKKRKPFTEETKRKMSIACTGRRASAKTLKILSDSHKGISPSIEARKKQSATLKLLGIKPPVHLGEDNVNWAGGKSFEVYPREFSESLKESIRERDKRTCQKCGKTERQELDQYGRRLAVNHINFNKNDCRSENLNALCMRCNVDINSNREFWEGYFLKQLVDRGVVDVS